MSTLEKSLIDNYWIEKLRGREVLQHTTSAVVTSAMLVEQQDLSYFYKITGENEIAEFTILLTLSNLLRQQYFGESQLVFSIGIGPRKNIPLLFSFCSPKEGTIKDYLQEAKQETQAVYKHATYTQNSVHNLPFERYTKHAFYYNSEPIAHQFDFSLQVEKYSNKSLKLQLSYSQEFNENNLVASQFLNSLRNWIINLQVNLDESATAVPIVSADEREVLLHVFNRSKNFTERNTLVNSFEEQVKKTPHNIAIIFNKSELTYADTNERANKLANYLIETFDIRPGQLVGVKLKRTEELLVAILAVLKTGAAYVPIDIDYPAERIAYIQKDSGAQVLVDEDLMGRFRASAHQFSRPNILVPREAEDLAYIIYTSGTTGHPKGVMITNQNAVELIQWAKSTFDTAKFELVYAATSHCFDLSIFEMFFPLSVGKKIRVLDNPLAIGNYLEHDTNILLNTVPSAIRSLLEAGHTFENVRFINIAGEAFPVDIAKKLQQFKAEVRNLYGPSEDTTYSTCYKLNKEAYKSIPIGKPLPNTSVYILDEHRKLLPIGFIGKLYIAGAGLSNGYLNRPELTEEKFVQDPFNSHGRMYDTGDLAKWLPDGNLEFHGRQDQQIKLRGYRIELGEIEHVLAHFSEDITQVAVDVRTTQNEQILVGFYTGTKNLDQVLLRAFVATQLPAYMVPARFSRLSIFPLNANGKIDRNALRNVEAAEQRKEYVAPANEQELTLANIWEEVLNVQSIGRNDHFFELGGHSLMISQIINRMHKRMGKGVSFKLFYSNPTIASLADALSDDELTPIHKAEHRASYPVTPSQRRLWMLSQLQGGAQAYCIIGGKQFLGLLHIDDFINAFNIVVERHAILRASFRMDNKGELLFFVSPFDKWNYYASLEDISTSDHPYERLEEYIKTTYQQTFDLLNAPLFRATLVKLSAKDFVFLFSIHHILVDGWSIEIITAEILQTYRQLQAGQKVDLPTLPIQFHDYALWLERAREQDKNFVLAKEYWLNNFRETVPFLQLPSFKQRPQIKTFNGGKVYHTYSKEFSNSLRRFARQQHTTLFTVLLASVRALLSRYSNQYDFAIGTPIAGREHSDLENQVGLYLNTLAIRTTLSPDDNFLEIVHKEQQILVEAYSHQQFPFDALIESLNLERDASRSPLFDVIVVLQTQQQLTQFEDKLSLPGLDISSYPITTNTAKFDIAFSFEENDTLSLEIEYNTDIYDEVFINNIHTHLENLCINGIGDTACSFKAIDILSREEKQFLLESFNSPFNKTFSDKTVVDLFYEQVATNPAKMAVIFGEKEISYAELNYYSNRIAHFLLHQWDVCNTDIIAVRLEKSDWIIASLLGILKTGAAYVPIDPRYPASRIEYVLRDTKARVIVDDNFLQKAMEYSTPDNESSEVKIDSQDTAYIIYTSGSTGTPKGVMISHGSLTNFLLFYQLEEHRSSLTCNYVFDVSVLEIFASITSGSTLIIPTQETVNDPRAYAHFLCENRISHCYIHPMHLDEIALHLDSHDEIYLKRVLIGVESIRKESVAWYCRQGILVINGYGPTEATICSTSYTVAEHYITLIPNIPIGKPLPNYHVYILNEDTQVLQPRGSIGELCVSGVGLAKGYLNLEQLSRDKFQPNPFFQGQYIYRTGDLARWLPDGNLEFIGRKDYQIKIRGNRVETAEIEHFIGTYSPGFTYILVDAKEVNQEKVLIAYYTTSEIIAKSALRSYLQDKLPYYMIPNYYIELQNMPLTTNGKIDRAKLPEVSDADIIRKDFVLPANPTEKEILSIWQKLLGQQKIGIKDDFFELGGSSLTVTKLLNEYNKSFEVNIDFKSLYSNNTIADHAELISNLERSSFEYIETLAEQEFYEVSPSQLRYWLIYKIHGKSKEFNIYNELLLPSDLNHEAFNIAFNSLVKRHEALRTIFPELNGEPKQKIALAEYVSVPLFSTEQEAIEVIYKHVFELDTYPLFKVGLVKRGSDNLLLFNIHHIISDGWSMGIISHDLLELYNSEISNTIPNLPSLEISYKDYAVWQNYLLNNDRLVSQKLYWESVFFDHPTYLELPIDYSNKLEKPETSSYYTLFLDEILRQKLSDFSRESETSMFTVFAAALIILLNRLTATDDIIIGIPAANRNHYQLHNIVGCFLNTLVLRNKLVPNMSFASFLQQVNDNLINTLANQNYPFERLIDKLNYVRDNARLPIISVFLNLLDFEARPTALIGSFLPVNGVLLSTPKFELEYYIKSYANGISINCVYNSDLFKGDTISYWTNEYISIIEQIIKSENVLINDFTIFKNQIVEEDPKPTNDFIIFNDYEINQSIAQRFEQQVARFPKSVAIYSNNKFVTYEQLNNSANFLAHKILQQVDEDTKRIALLLDHDEACIISMLGVLKAGYAYVPVDGGDPLDRIHFILKDSDAHILIYSEAYQSKVHQIKQLIPNLVAITLPIDYVSENIPNPTILTNPLSEAYILYTSGSTGRPKGVIQLQRNLLHYIRTYTNNVHISTNDNLSLFSTYTFDASIKDIYGAVLNGAVVSFYSIRENGLNQLADWLNLQRITIIHMVPTIYRYFLKALPENEVLETVRLVDLGGEPCYKTDLELFKKHFNETAFLVNDYGPTEATIIAQKFLSHNSQITRNSIPLGKAVDKTEIFILDAANQRLGIYQEGEITFSSSYLSKGYLNRQELNAKVFITDPLDAERSLYKSGDIGRILPNGEIEFVRRKDTQIKLNGIRIELAEIESHLENVRGVEQAVVVLKQINGHDFLTAYLRKEPAVDVSYIVEQLTKWLPKSMLPSVYIPIQAFPLTRTGKIDRGSLPQPTVEDIKTTSHASPETILEATMVEIWASVLDLNAAQIGIDDNLFELGGNSLLAIKLANKLEKKLGVVVRVKDVFTHSSIRLLARWLGSQTESHLHIPLASQADDYVLSTNQRRLWIACQQGNSAAYNISGALLLEGVEGTVDTDLIKNAYALLLQRHESLRTVLVNGENILPKQKILSSSNDVFKLLEEKIDVSIEVLDELVKRESNVIFNLNGQALIRAKIINFSGNKLLLVVVMHHLISDGWSMNIFIKEWIALYIKLKQGIIPELQPLFLQYKDFASWQQYYTATTAFEATRTYWKQRLAGPLPVLQLPISKKMLKAEGEGEVIDFFIPDNLYDSLKKAAVANQVSLFTLLFSVFNVLLHHISHQQQIILGTSVAGRSHENLEPIIGFFVNTIAIKTSIESGESFLELLKRTNEHILNDLEHQEMPFDELLTHLDYDRNADITPVFQARFVLNNERDHTFAELLDMQIHTSVITIKDIHPKFNLSMIMHHGRSLSGGIEYKTALFDREIIQLIITTYVKLLEHVVKQPTMLIEQLDTFTEAYHTYLNKSKATIQDSFLRKLQTLQTKK